MSTARLNAIDAWYASCIDPQNSSVSAAELCSDMVTALQLEVPATLEVTFERACNLQCEHCVYGPERSSRWISEKRGLPEVLLNIVRQLPAESDLPFSRRPVLIHGGRILRRWHLEVLRRVRELRADMEISLIDNGTYVHHLDEFARLGFRFNWLDLSVDGLEEVHNRQRDPSGNLRGESSPWNAVLKGFERAREVVIPYETGGTISALMTLTRLNFRDIEGLANFIFENNLADEMHYCPMSPERSENFQIELDEKELGNAWRQIVRAFDRHGPKRVFIKLFELDDLKKLERVVGSRALWRSLTGESVRTFVEGSAIFEVEGVPVSFFPVSIWPHEAFFVDADGVNRVAHTQKFTINELRRGLKETAPYTIAALTPEENYPAAYRRAARHWWKHFGATHYINELEYFAALRKRAEE